MKKNSKPDQFSFKRALYRANTDFLQVLLCVFQSTSMLLLAFKSETFDFEALLLCVLMPVITTVALRLFSKYWHVDKALYLLTMLLVSISIITLKDIARSGTTSMTQAKYAFLGLFAMAAGIVFIRYCRTWELWSKFIAPLSIIMLLLPFVIGQWYNGAKIWLKFGSVTLQPSEFVKISLVFILASSLSGSPSLKRSIPALLFSACSCVILLVERDLGALLVYFLVTLFVYYVATRNLAVTGLAIGAGAVGSVAAYKLFPYVAKRIEMFVNPWSDPMDKGYQIIQALIALGSGGIFGMGLGLGHPRNVPLYYSDFIFASITEEFGLLFAICLLFIYAILLLRGISVAMNARREFHALLAFGIVTLITVQAFVNVGGNIKLIPLTGLTLPFVSAGNNSLVSLMGMMGMLLGISSINAEDEVHDLSRLQSEAL